MKINMLIGMLIFRTRMGKADILNGDFHPKLLPGLRKLIYQTITRGEFLGRKTDGGKGKNPLNAFHVTADLYQGIVKCAEIMPVCCMYNDAFLCHFKA